MLEASGKIAKVVALQPDPTDYYASPEDAERLLAPMKEDRSMRISPSPTHSAAGSSRR